MFLLWHMIMYELFKGSCVTEDFFFWFVGLPSPSKHYSLRVDNAVPMVTQPPQTLQLQPQLIAQPQVCMWPYYIYSFTRILLVFSLFFLKLYLYVVREHLGYISYGYYFQKGHQSSCRFIIDIIFMLFLFIFRYQHNSLYQYLWWNKMVDKW